MQWATSYSIVIDMMTEAEFRNKIEDIGGEAYVTGGWVRDRLMGRCPQDKDYVICKVDEHSFVSVFPGALRTGGRFPVFVLPIDGQRREVALARTEKKTAPGHRGFEIGYGPEIAIEEDLFRRDITINSMAWSLGDEMLIDPYGGRKDIDTRVIRATSDHFTEDPVRALRAARLAAEFGFAIEKHTVEMMSACGDELADEPPDRLFRELSRAMASDRPSMFFLALTDADIVSAVLPPLDSILKKEGPNGKKAYQKAMNILDRAACHSKRPEIRFSALIKAVHSVYQGIPSSDLMDEVERSIRLPVLWRRCMEFILSLLWGPESANDPEVVADILTKLQSHPIGIDGCTAILKAECVLEKYPFIAKSAAYFEAMKEARTEVPKELEGKDIGLWIRKRQIEKIGEILRKG